MSVIYEILLDDDFVFSEPEPPQKLPLPETSVTPPSRTQTRTQMFEYDATTGQLLRTIIEPGNAELRVEVAYDYDAWGNKISDTASPAGTPAITSTKRYDASGKFLLEQKNALGHKDTYGYDSRFGHMAKIQDRNGRIFEAAYGDFGNKELDVYPDKTKLYVSYAYCQGISGGTAICPRHAKYVVQEKHLAADSVTEIAPWSKKYFDSEDREIRTEFPGFDGSVLMAETEYNGNGEISRVSRPYSQGMSIQWTTYEYDEVHRLIRIFNPDGSNVAANYSGTSTTIRNELGQNSTYITNSKKNLIRSIDNNGMQVSYDYSPFGNMWRTVDPDGNIVANEFDLGGRRKNTSDPDLGFWAYKYDALGRLLNQTSARGKVLANKYDALSRVISSESDDLNSSWIFDVCTYGLGHVCSVKSNNGYAQSFTYNENGKISSSTTTVDAAYSFLYSYDANGRLSTVSYPAGLVLKYSYTSQGYLKDIRENGTDALYWQANEMDSDGNITVQTFGNGIITHQQFDPATGRVKSIFSSNTVADMVFDFDALGNMIKREDRNRGLSESFLYDSLGRLQSATVNSAAAGIYNQSTSYSNIGNIVSRSGVGAYTYGDKNRGPHGLTSLALENGDVRRYYYDANGNVTTELQKNLAGISVPEKWRKIDYTSYDMPLRITDGSQASASFMYGANFQRVKQTTSASTIIYVHPDQSGGMAYEKEVRADGSVEHRQYISVNGVPIAIVKKNGSVVNTEYFHRDHLQSVIAVTDAQGKVVESLSYEPFGKRRMLSGSVDDKSILRGLVTKRGFTGHEHLDNFGLVNMNGRVYDPAIGRFLSADPTVPDSSDLQSLNRYSYTRNNPLSKVDPTGYVDQRLETEYRDLLDWITASSTRDRSAESANNGVQTVTVVGEKEDRSASNSAILRGAGTSSTGGDASGNKITAAEFRRIAASYRELSEAKLHWFLALVADSRPGFALQAEKYERWADALEGDGLSIAQTIIVDVIAPNAGNAKMKSGWVSKVNYGSLPNPRNAGPGKEFPKSLKRKALDLNRAANGGVVKSDESGIILSKPEKSMGGVTPDPYEWQFDHYYPKNCGGTNCSSNLKIISRKENRDKSDKIPEQ